MLTFTLKCTIHPRRTIFQRYSVGDRVEVLSLLWEDELGDAEVIKVHTLGAVDVAYDTNDSVGVHLAAEDCSSWVRKEEEGVLRGRTTALMKPTPEDSAQHTTPRNHAQ